MSSTGVDPEAVAWAYRLFLDREPEDAAALSHAAAQLTSWEDVRRHFTTSDEYLARHPSSVRTSLSGSEPPMRIEGVTPADHELLLEHVASAWTELGRSEPHYSVITNEKYRSATVREHLEDFYASGQTDVERLVATLRRNGLHIEKDSTCLELGCGVGRVTAHLAGAFANVIAVDVSPDHLELARQHLSNSGIENVQYVLLRDFNVFDQVEQFGFFYSQIVLQHNPAPVIDVLLDRALQRLLPGGLSYFQVTTYREGYSFDLDEYLNGDFKHHGIEMHALPQRRIFEIAAHHGVELLEVLEDGCTGMRPGELSNTFLVRKSDPHRDDRRA